MRFVLGHHMRVPEIRAVVFTPERNAKISAAHADGRIPNPSPKYGADHPAWRGDEVSYAQAHARVVVARGPAAEYDCAECGVRAQEWALNHDAEKTTVDFHGGITKPLSADVAAYVALCRNCHRIADRRGGYRA
jgi:hypothetical protein